MNKQLKIKVSIDIIMTFLAVLLMGYGNTGRLSHEIIGTIMLVIVIIHNVLNKQWYKVIFKGKYTSYRIIQTIVTILTLFMMILTMCSGILLSRDIFGFINIPGTTAIAREVHHLASNWSYILMGIHLGLHWNIIIRMVKKVFNKSNIIFNSTLRGVGFLIIIYGVYAFIKRGVLANILMINMFSTFNANEIFIIFIIDYLAIMSLFIAIGYYGLKLVTWINNID